jgi:hypothetical protein
MGRSSLVWEITQRRLVCLSTFRYILPVPSWMVKSSWTTWPVKMRLLGCSITFVANYQSALRNISEERRPHLHGDRSQKSVNVTRGFSVESRASRQVMKQTARNEVMARLRKGELHLYSHIRSNDLVLY